MSDIELSTSEMTEFIKNTPAGTSSATKEKAPVKRTKKVKVDLPDEDIEIPKEEGGVSKQRKPQIIKANKVVSLVIKDAKEFVQPTCRATTPFFDSFEQSIDGKVSCLPNCVCGKQMMIKGKQFICPKPSPCNFTITTAAFVAMMEHEYINGKIACKQGITLPKCGLCRGFSICTGGQYYGEDTIVLRCKCDRRNTKALMLRSNEQHEEALVRKLCETGVWVYSSLPYRKTADGEAGAADNMEEY